VRSGRLKLVDQRGRFVGEFLVAVTGREPSALGFHHSLLPHVRRIIKRDRKQLRAAAVRLYPSIERVRQFQEADI
jgi:hypothetical protein